MRLRLPIWLGFGLTGALLAGAVTLEATGSSGAAFAGEGTSEGVRGLLSEAARAMRGENGQIHMRVPPSQPLLRPAAPHLPKAVPSGERRAHAYQWVSRVFDRPRKSPRAIGFVRRGMVLHADNAVSGRGCKGTWYTLAGQPGVVCSTDGFTVQREARDLHADQRVPDVSRALPFEYAKAKTHDTLRFYEVPSKVEEAEIARATEAGQRLPKVVQTKMAGVYLLALDHEQRVRGRVFYRTVRGHYVRAEDLDPKPEPKMRGVELGDGKSLPYAFVYDHAEEPAAVYQVDNDGTMPQHVGIADNHARIPIEREQEVGGRAMVIGADGIALQRSDVRVASLRKRPDDVPPRAKWIHVDLDEQTLVAYEGDTPVFVTLVSSGLEDGFATPAGLFQVREKHISTTMSGPDPDEGYYEVEQVPWTMYYYDSYALHGAYWHDTFGKTRSHGCTNISPVDARWLFYWSDDEVPSGWNARRQLKGTWIYLTRDS